MAKPKKLPKQEQQTQPGREYKMQPEPEIIRKNYKGSDKLIDQKALITGGDSGIGRAVAVHFAREGADVAIVYRNEDADAEETKKLIEKEGRKCLVIRGDIVKEDFQKELISTLKKEFGKLDVLVNNAAVQFPEKELQDITDEHLETTFDTNILAMIRLTRSCMPLLKKGSRIINTTSITAYRGSAHLLDYSATKGAIVAFTRSLASNLVKKGIRVNGVAPGPIWTPLIPATFDAERVSKFGQDTPMGRPGQPSELAPAYLFLASEDSSYITGEVIHVNGGSFIHT